MLFLNPKVNVFKIIISQFSVFKNAKTDKFSAWDFCCFIVFPIVISVLLVFSLGYSITNTLASVLTTVFAFVFTVLFGFAAILVGKINSCNKIEKQVTEETFISVLSSTLLSLIAAIVCIVLLNIDEKAECIRSILSTVIYGISFMTIMLMLMITKRTYIIYCNTKK